MPVIPSYLAIALSVEDPGPHTSPVPPPPAPVVHYKTPVPSVVNTCPGVPSSIGNIRVYDPVVLVLACNETKFAGVSGS